MKPKKAPKNGAAPKKRMPKWKRHPDDYRTDEMSRLQFATRADIDEAIGIVWGGKLTGMPFDLGPDGMSLIVPNVSIPYFVEAGVKFTEKIVTS
jgi:hypothetical protein